MPPQKDGEISTSRGEAKQSGCTVVAGVLACLYRIAPSLFSRHAKAAAVSGLAATANLRWIALREDSATSVADAPNLIGIILEPAGEGVAADGVTGESLERLVVMDATEVV